MKLVLDQSNFFVIIRMEMLKADVKLSETVNFFEPIEETESEEGRDSPVIRVRNNGLLSKRESAETKTLKGGNSISEFTLCLP